MPDENNDETKKLELFHAINDAGDSAAVRSYISAHHLKVSFRNVFYPEVRADLIRHGGGDRTPALWDGTQLYEGKDAVLTRLGRPRDV